MALDFRQLMREERQRARHEQAVAASSSISTSSSISNGELHASALSTPDKSSATAANFEAPLSTWRQRCVKDARSVVVLVIILRIC